jgi:hypothetical protein
MIDNLDEQLGFAPDYDSPVPYMKRTRDYYTAIGYTTPYRWAHYLEAPFQPLKKPLAQSRVTIISTAALYDPTKGDQGPGAKYNGGAKFYQVYDGDTSKQHDLRISHIGYDRIHTSAEDSGTWFPLPQLIKAKEKGRIGEVAPRFFGAPTNRSHRITIETDAPEILKRCREDKVDVAVLVPNCPVCHQTTALVARHLEANGIPTVIMGCAKDIIEHAAAPRFLFSDFPLGNSCGKAHNHAIATALERRRQVEARLQQHRDHERRRARQAPSRVRQAEGNRARPARGVIANETICPGSCDDPGLMIQRPKTRSKRGTLRDQTFRRRADS